MKEYRVMITESQWYTIEVTAETYKDAEDQAWEILNKSGFQEFEFEGAEIEDSAYVEEITR